MESKIFSTYYKVPFVFYRVKLALNRETREAIAVKIIDLEKAAEAYENVRKEVCRDCNKLFIGTHVCELIFYVIVSFC